MKIIKRGNKLETKIFTCSRCGTIFEANEAEYYWKGVPQWEIDNYGIEALRYSTCCCKCPVCKSISYITYYDGKETSSS